MLAALHEEADDYGLASTSTDSDTRSKRGALDNSLQELERLAHQEKKQERQEEALAIERAIRRMLRGMSFDMYSQHYVYTPSGAIPEVTKTLLDVRYPGNWWVDEETDRIMVHREAIAAAIDRLRSGNIQRIRAERERWQNVSKKKGV